MGTQQFQSQSFRGLVCLALAEQKFAATFIWWHFLYPCCWIPVMELALALMFGNRGAWNASCLPGFGRSTQVFITIPRNMFSFWAGQG